VSSWGYAGYYNPKLASPWEEEPETAIPFQEVRLEGCWNAGKVRLPTVLK
jgi:hypothetical protein